MLQPVLGNICGRKPVLSKQINFSKVVAGHPLANPVLIAVIVLVALLWATGTPYATYFEGAQFVHFLLGPATVALAIPLYAQFDRLKRMAGPLLVALLPAPVPPLLRWLTEYERGKGRHWQDGMTGLRESRFY